MLALMLLTEARGPARVDAAGRLVTLDEQDRGSWDRELMDRGRGLAIAALRAGPPGPGAPRAAIAAVHADAPTSDATDWPQIATLYGLLTRAAPSRWRWPLDCACWTSARTWANSPRPTCCKPPALTCRGAWGRTAEARTAYDLALTLVGDDTEREFLTRRRDQLDPATGRSP